MHSTSSSPVSAGPSSGHVLPREAAELLRRFHFPSSTRGLGSATPLPTDSMPLLDLVLHLNDTYALSFWVLRSLASELSRLGKEKVANTSASVPDTLATTSARERELLAGCDTLQHARDVLDQHLGHLVLGPVLLSCLLFYVDASAYETAALRRDVCSLVAPGGGPARYCVDDDGDDDDDQEEGEALISNSDSGNSSSKSLSKSSRGASEEEEDEEGSRYGAPACTKVEAPTRLENRSSLISAATRRRWQRERAKVTSMPPPQSDVAVLLVNIAKALHESSQGAAPTSGVAAATPAATHLRRSAFAGSLAVPSNIDAPHSKEKPLPWLCSSASAGLSACEGNGADALLCHPRVVSALLRRGQSCLTNPASSPSSPAAQLHRHYQEGTPARGHQSQGLASPPHSTTYARYCEGLRRRCGGGDHRARLADEQDGVVVRPCGPPPVPAPRSSGKELASARRRISAGPLARLFLQPPSQSSLPLHSHPTCKGGHDQGGCQVARHQVAHPSLPVSAESHASVVCRAQLLSKEKKRERSDTHWSVWQPRSAYPTPPEKMQKVTSMREPFKPVTGGVSWPIDVDCGMDVATADRHRRSSPSRSSKAPAQRLPLDVQRHCLEYVAPRHLHTACAVCVAWYRLIRCSPPSSALARAYHASIAVTRAYTLFFRQQWGEQALPVTLLTSLHRLRFAFAADSAAVTLVQVHWSRTRVNVDVCAYVRHCIPLSPLRHLLESAEDDDEEGTDASPASDIRAHMAPSFSTLNNTASPMITWSRLKPRPLSAILYVFYVLCLIPTTPSLCRPASPQTAENLRVHSALQRLLRVWAAELTCRDVWSTTSLPTTSLSSSSALLAREAIRQQKLIWWLLTNPSTISSSSPSSVGSMHSRRAEDFFAQLWTQWPAVQGVLDHTEMCNRCSGADVHDSE